MKTMTLLTTRITISPEESVLGPFQRETSPITPTEKFSILVTCYNANWVPTYKSWLQFQKMAG